MADLHPNDIGLATFEDVGDVSALQTNAKKVVDAINEIKETGSSLSSLEDQLYVDGENNIILGKNNIVYGSNNLIIGSDNVITANNISVIGSEKKHIYHIITSMPIMTLTVANSPVIPIRTLQLCLKSEIKRC